MTCFSPHAFQSKSTEAIAGLQVKESTFMGTAEHEGLARSVKVIRRCYTKGKLNLQRVY